MNFYRYLAEVLFFGFVFIIFYGAFQSLRARYLMHAVLGLALSLFGVAGLFYHLGSPFLALMQLIIGIGAICVILAFGIMVGPRPSQEAAKTRHTLKNRFLAIFASLVVGILLIKTLIETQWIPVTAQRGDFSIKYLGASLLHPFCLPFELISLVLLAAIVGALIIARIGREE